MSTETVPVTTPPNAVKKPWWWYTLEAAACQLEAAPKKQSAGHLPARLRDLQSRIVAVRGEP
jgi:hypothetical protein